MGKQVQGMSCCARPLALCSTSSLPSAGIVLTVSILELAVGCNQEVLERRRVSVHPVPAWGTQHGVPSRWEGSEAVLPVSQSWDGPAEHRAVGRDFLHWVLSFLVLRH